MEELYGGMEGGGTKFICAVGTGPDEIIAETRFPTTTPDETLDQAISSSRNICWPASAWLPSARWT